MKIVESLNKGIKRNYQIDIDKESILLKKDEQIKKILPNINMKGFRAGKVPLDVVEKKYLGNIITDVINDCVRDAIPKIVEQYKINYVSQPKLDMKTDAVNFLEGLSFELQFEVYPEISNIDYKKIKLSTRELVVSDEEKLELVNKLRSYHNTYEAITRKRKTRLQDKIIFDFLGKVDGTPFAGGEAKKYELVLGSNNFIPGFEDQLVGHSIDEDFVIDITFPEEYQADLAGKDATFDIKIHEIHAPKEISDDVLLEKLKFDSIESLSDDITKNYINNFNNAERNTNMMNLINAIYDLNIVEEIPQGLIDIALDNMKKNQEEAKKRDPNHKELDSDSMLLDVKKRVVASLILDHIALNDNIDVIDEELKSAIEQQAKQYSGNEQQVIDYYNNNASAKTVLKNQLLEDKILSYVISKANTSVEKVKISDL